LLQKKIQKNGLIATAVEIFQNPGLNAREVHVHLESQDDESAFDYEWDLEKQVQEEERTSSRRTEQEDSAEDEDEDESEESHEEEVRDSLMGEIFARVNTAIAGKGIEQQDLRKMRQNAGRWMQRTSQKMKWAEDDKDYESEESRAEQWDERTQGRAGRCQHMRTQYVREDERVCFTTRPVLSCTTGCQPASVKQVNVSFHCLSVSSPFTTQLVKDSERTVLTQLAHKRVDFKRDISVPVSCSA